MYKRQEIGIDRRVRHGHMTAGRVRHVWANAMEAVLGAIFIEAGFDAARDVILDLWRDIAARDVTAPKDAKSALQELVQQNTSGVLPRYEYTEPVGASHNPVFSVRVTAMGHSATATGASKKEASTAAAAALLKILAI